MISHVERSADVTADQRPVFEYATDPARFADYVAGYASGRVTTSAGTGPGASYEWVAELGPLRLPVVERVVTWDGGRRADYEGRVGPVHFGSSLWVDDVGPGRSRVHVRIEWTHPPWLLGRVGDGLVRRLVATEVERSLARLERAFGPASSRTEPRSGDRAFEPDEVARLYGKRAARYDFESRLYRLIGFRIDRYRQMAVDALALQPGATVVEIGCGTGANFPLLERAVGRAGRIIGVDLTEAMLEQARRRVLLEGWPNVELVRTDAASFGFPSGVNGILSTFALTLSPEFDAIIARGARALAPGGRWVVLDMKMPDDWPPWLVRAAVALARPYGVTLGAGVRHPWDSFSRCLPRSWMRELYLGAAFLAVGVAGQRPS